MPAIAFATTGGGPSKAAPSTGSRPAAQELAAFDGRPSAFGGDWSTQTLPAWVPAPTTSTTQPAAPPTTTGTAAVVSAQGRYLGTFVVTCYDLGGHTATGTTPTTATVAVDPRIIPLGTRLNISGVGERIAQDTGGAIRGDRLDIWEPTYGQCAAWGVQDRQVWIG